MAIREIIWFTVHTLFTLQWWYWGRGQHCAFEVSYIDDAQVYNLASQFSRTTLHIDDDTPANMPRSGTLSHLDPPVCIWGIWHCQCLNHMQSWNPDNVVSYESVDIMRLAFYLNSALFVKRLPHDATWKSLSLLFDLECGRTVIL